MVGIVIVAHSSELAEAIKEMIHESLDDIRDTLSKPSQNVFLEYIALLLWIVAKQAAIILLI